MRRFVPIVGWMVFTACPEVETPSEDDAPVPLDTGPYPTEDAALQPMRVILASPDLAPACAPYATCVDLVIGDAPIPAASPFPFGASTGYLPLSAGRQSVTMYDPGTDEVALAVNLGVVGDGIPRTVLVHGVTPLGGALGTVLTDAVAPQEGKVMVRIHHLLYGRGAFDVRLGTRVLAGPVSPGAATTFVAIDAGSHTLGFDLDRNGAADVPVSFDTDFDNDESTPDPAWVDVLVLPAPGTNPPLPLLLVHDAMSNEPAILEPGGG